MDTLGSQAFWEGIQKALGIDKGTTKTGTIPPLGGKPGFGKPGAAAGPAGTHLRETLLQSNSAKGWAFNTRS